MTGSAVELVQALLQHARLLASSDVAESAQTTGGMDVTLRCTDPAVLASVAKRLARSAHAATAPAVTLDFLDSASLGWTYPSAWAGDEQQRRMLVRALADAGIGASIPLDPAADVSMPWMFYDPHAAHGLILVESMAHVSPELMSAPFAQLFHFALAASKARLLHAGSLASINAGAIILGDAGAGKSATTLAGLAQGLGTAGDDMIAMRLDGREAWPIYRNLKQSPAGLRRFPELGHVEAVGTLNWQGKLDFDAEAIRPGCMRTSIPVNAILLPIIAYDRRTELVPATPTEVFGHVAPGLLEKFPGARGSGFSFLTRLTRSLPSFWIRLSEDPEEIGRSISTFLENCRVESDAYASRAPA